MKSFFTVVLLIITHNISFAQDSIRELGVAFKAGGYYKTFFQNKYITPTPVKPEDDDLAHQFDGFTKVPTHGFFEGLIFNYKISKTFFIISGLMYYNRKDIYESNPDTVAKYHTNQPIPNIIKYYYVDENIEFPLLIQYYKKKISVSAGVNIPVLSFRRATYTYFVNLYPQYTGYGITQKVTESIEMSLMIFPTLQISYDTRIENLPVNPFFAIDYGRKRSFYLQGGIIFPMGSAKRSP